MNEQLEFRDAGAEDVEAVVRLVESAYRGEASRAGWTTEADLLGGQRTDAAEVLALVTSPSSRVILAHDDGALVGCVLLEDRPGTAYVGMFAVSPTLQARGVGRALLGEAERVARVVLGRHRVEMTVLAQRPELIAWYERRGYRRTGETRPFSRDERHGVHLRAGLVLEVLVKAL